MTPAQRRAYRARHAQAIERETQSPAQPGQSYVPFFRGEAAVPDQNTPPAIDPIALNAMQARGFAESHRPADSMHQESRALPQVGPGVSIRTDADFNRPDSAQAIGTLPAAPGGGVTIHDTRHDRSLDVGPQPVVPVTPDWTPDR